MSSSASPPEPSAAAPAGGLGVLARGTAIYGLGSVVIRLLGFLTLPLFTRYLTPADYGISALLAMIGLFATPVFLLGLGTSLGTCYFARPDRAGRDRTIWTGFLVLIGSSALLLALGAAFVEPLGRALLGTPAHADLVLLTLLGTAAGILVTPFQLGLQFQQRALAYTQLTIATGLAGVGLSVLFVVGLRWGVTGVIMAQVATQLIALVLTLAVFRRGASFGLERGLVRALLRDGLPMVPSFAFLFVIQQSNRSILEWTRGLDAVGLYSVGASLGMPVAVAVAAFSNAWTPYFLSFRQRQQEAPATLGRAITLYLLGFGGLALLFFIFAEPVVSLMVAPRFHDAWRVVGLAACAQYLLGAFALFLPPVYFADEVKAVNVGQAIAAVACLGLNLALIPPFGATGAALALALGVAVMVGAQLLWNRARGDRYMRLPLDWPKLATFALLFAGIAGLTLLQAFSTPLTRWAAAGAETLALAAALYALLGAGERAALAARLRRRGAA